MITSDGGRPACLVSRRSSPGSFPRLSFTPVHFSSPGGLVPRAGKKGECWTFLDWRLNSENDSPVHGQPSFDSLFGSSVRTSLASTCFAPFSPPHYPYPLTLLLPPGGSERSERGRRKVVKRPDSDERNRRHDIRRKDAAVYLMRFRSYRFVWSSAPRLTSLTSHLTLVSSVPHSLRSFVPRHST